MKRQIGLALRKILPPQLYRKLLHLWRERIYWKNLTIANFVRRPPVVEAYPDGRPQLADLLRRINVVAPTPMCHAMLWHGSDKSLYRHNYTNVYNALFDTRRSLRLRIFEIGLGSTDSSIRFNMAADGVPGASLRAWRSLFPNAQIFGADIDRKCLFQEERIRTTYCDQLDASAIRQMWSQPGFQEGMDLIVDDGLHTFEGNSTFLRESLGHLRPGGIFVIEDIAGDALDQWRELLLSDFPAHFPNHEIALVMLPHPNNSEDNNMLIIRRPAMENQGA